jgi:hypothetical protein
MSQTALNSVSKDAGHRARIEEITRQWSNAEDAVTGHLSLADETFASFLEGTSVSGTPFRAKSDNLVSPGSAAAASARKALLRFPTAGELLQHHMTEPSSGSSGGAKNVGLFPDSSEEIIAKERERSAAMKQSFLEKDKKNLAKFEKLRAKVASLIEERRGLLKKVDDGKDAMADSLWAKQQEHDREVAQLSTLLAAQAAADREGELKAWKEKCAAAEAEAKGARSLMLKSEKEEAEAKDKAEEAAAHLKELTEALYELVEVNQSSHAQLVEAKKHLSECAVAGAPLGRVLARLTRVSTKHGFDCWRRFISGTTQALLALKSEQEADQLYAAAADEVEAAADEADLAKRQGGMLVFSAGVKRMQAQRLGKGWRRWAKFVFQAGKAAAKAQVEEEARTALAEGIHAERQAGAAGAVEAATTAAAAATAVAAASAAAAAEVAAEAHRVALQQVEAAHLKVVAGLEEKSRQDVEEARVEERQQRLKVHAEEVERLREKLRSEKDDELRALEGKQKRELEKVAEKTHAESLALAVEAAKKHAQELDEVEKQEREEEGAERRREEAQHHSNEMKSLEEKAASELASALEKLGKEHAVAMASAMESATKASEEASRRNQDAVEKEAVEKEKEAAVKLEARLKEQAEVLGEEHRLKLEKAVAEAEAGAKTEADVEAEANKRVWERHTAEVGIIMN